MIYEWVSMAHWWNDTDRGKLKYWEKNIIQCGWWMDEYGAMVEWYWQGKTEVLGEKHYTVWVVDGWVWSNGGMVLAGENWSTREKHYTASLVDEYGAMVEWYWQGKTEVLGEKHYTAWVVDECMSMEQWWNDTDRGKLKYKRETLYSVGGRWMFEYGAMVEWY